MYQGKAHLIEITSHVIDIPQRVREYDSSMTVVWNAKREQFELHSTLNKGDTFCLSVPELDERLIRLIRQNDVYNRGEAIYAEMDAHNERLEAAARRERRNHAETVAREMYPVVKKEVEYL